MLSSAAAAGRQFYGYQLGCSAAKNLRTIAGLESTRQVYRRGCSQRLVGDYACCLLAHLFDPVHPLVHKDWPRIHWVVLAYCGANILSPPG